MLLPEGRNRIVERAKDYLEEHYYEDLSLTEVAEHVGITASLHDLKLIDLFDSAALLGYQAEGLCLGMQVENASPVEATEGLTRPVHDALPLLVDVVVGELARLGFPLSRKASIE